MISRLREPLVLFVDESLDSLTVVDALRATGANVERLTDHFPKGTPDETWLAHAGGRGWVVLTRDKRIRYRQLERLALTEAKARAFVFTGGNVTGKDTAAILVHAFLSKRVERLVEMTKFRLGLDELDLQSHS